MAVAAMLVSGIGVAAAYQGTDSSGTTTPAVQTVKTAGGCGCDMAKGAGGCGAAGCTAGCTQCKGQCGGGCSGGCAAKQK